MKYLERNSNLNAKDLFMCLDWNQEMMVKPNYAAYLVISLVPCDLFEDGSNQDDECVADLDK